MAEALNCRAFVLPFGFVGIDRRADVSHRKILFKLDLARGEIDFDLSAAHAGLPK